MKTDSPSIWHVMPTNGFFVHSVSVLISVKTDPSTDSALKALLPLNPSTCVCCRDIQMRHDNTHDLHGSVNSWICHTSNSCKLNFSPITIWAALEEVAKTHLIAMQNYLSWLHIWIFIKCLYLLLKRCLISLLVKFCSN